MSPAAKTADYDVDARHLALGARSDGRLEEEEEAVDDDHGQELELQSRLGLSLVTLLWDGHCWGVPRITAEENSRINHHIRRSR